MKEELEALRQNDMGIGPTLHSHEHCGLQVNETLELLKARLVAKGFTQVLRADFTQTYSPVIKPATIQLDLTVALPH